jgi:mannose-6-phosphate isomerase-like protein (cupin superfamily)
MKTKKQNKRKAVQKAEPVSDGGWVKCPECGIRKMKVFDLRTMEAQPYAQRDKNVFYRVEGFKARIIELPPGGEMPLCEMASHVIFYVVKGSAEVTVNEKMETIEEGQCLITEPATLSMKTKNGVKIMGIQVERNGVKK